MGATALLNAFAQGPLDMAGFPILNCPSLGGGGGGGGTVTSIGLSMPPQFSVSTPNPIVSAGTFAVGWQNVNAKYFLGFIGTGLEGPDPSTGVPTFQPIPFSVLQGQVGVSQGGVPAGGAIGEALIKTGTPDYAVAWGGGTLPAGGLVGQIPVKSGAPDFTVSWEDTNYAEAIISPSVQTSSITSLMMGFGLQLTIKKSGMVLLVLYSNVSNSVAEQYCEWSARYGTGTPPAPNGAVTGSSKGTLQLATSTNAGDYLPVASAIVIPNLINGTTYWFDFTKRASGTGSAPGGAATWANPLLQVTEF